MDYIKSIIETTRKSIKTLHEMDGSIETLKANKTYSPEYLDQLVRAARDERGEAMRSACSEIDDLTDSYIESILDIDVPAGADLTDDAKLLSGGFKLSPHDLQVIFDRNAGNRTMMRMIIKYAADHDIIINRILYTAKEKREAAIGFANQAKAALNGGYYAELFSDDAYISGITPDELTADFKESEPA